MPTVRLHTRDPLRSYSFVLWSIDPGGQATMLAGVQKVSGLTASVGTYETWEGGNNLHRYANPDRVTWDTLTLEQGLALDDTLEKWAQAVLEWSRTGLPPKERLKRYLRIDVDEPTVARRGVVTPSAAPETVTKGKRQYLVKNAWISKFAALPRLDALSNEVALLSVEIVHEGWQLLRPGESLPTSASTPS